MRRIRISAVMLCWILIPAAIAAAAPEQQSATDDSAAIVNLPIVRFFFYDAGGVEWRGRRLDLDAIRRARESAIISFGSCSFTEPIGDLQTLDLL